MSSPASLKSGGGGSGGGYLPAVSMAQKQGGGQNVLSEESAEELSPEVCVFVCTVFLHLHCLTDCFLLAEDILDHALMIIEKNSIFNILYLLSLFLSSGSCKLLYF